MTIPEQITLLQRLSGLTQEALAKRLGVSFPAFNAWARGRATPRPVAQKRIAALLGEYGVSREIDSTLTATKAGLERRARSRRNILTEILGKPDVRDEFVLALTYHSNVIEGSTLTKGETAAVLFEDAVLKNRTLREQLEAKNHQAAVEFVLRTVNPRVRIHEAFILRMHAILLNGIQSNAGQYRNHGVRIVGANVPTANPASVQRLMDTLIRDINRPSADHVGQAGRIHARFEQIHPFTDGNGRVGRLLLVATLLRKNFPPAVIEQRRKREYLKLLNRAQLQEDFEPFERFLCEAVLIGYAIIERKRGA